MQAGANLSVDPLFETQGAYKTMPYVCRHRALDRAFALAAGRGATPVATNGSQPAVADDGVDVMGDLIAKARRNSSHGRRRRSSGGSGVGGGGHKKKARRSSMKALDKADIHPSYVLALLDAGAPVDEVLCSKACYSTC